MTPALTTLHPWQRAVLGVLLPLCFVAQQVWVPVHLALCEHLREHADGTHAAIAIAADHDEAEHAHVHEGTSEGPHRPHPADDHGDEVSELAVTRHAGHATLALVPFERASVVLLLPAHSEPLLAVDGARAPPLRAGAPPRAPPISI